LADDYIEALCKDLDGNIWIGTDQGLSCFKDGGFTNYTVKDGLSNKTVQQLCLGHDGSLWIGTAKGGLHRLKDGKIFPQTIEGMDLNTGVTSLHQDREEALWVGTARGLFRLKDGKTVHYGTMDGLASDWIAKVHEDPEGNIWVSNKSGVERYDSARNSFYSVKSTGAVQAMWSDREGSLWLGYARDGLARFGKGLFFTYTIESGLADDLATTVFQDRRGNIWIGTAQGLNLYIDGRLVTCTPKDAQTRHISAIAEDRDGTLWIGMNDRLFRLKDDKDCAGGYCKPEFIPILKTAMSGMNIRLMYGDREGALWIGTNYEGLLRYKDGQLTTYTIKNGLANNAVRGISEDLDGSLWLAPGAAD
jgi:ligand-binding sensor domain-containing protein